MASGTAYNGLLIALDCYLILNGVEITDTTKKDIDFYRANLSKKNKKLLGYLNSAYEVLHLLGYYDGITKNSILQEGLKDANFIISQIKPAN
jgi:hypothetical protein